MYIIMSIEYCRICAQKHININMHNYNLIFTKCASTEYHYVHACGGMHWHAACMHWHAHCRTGLLCCARRVDFPVLINDCLQLFEHTVVELEGSASCAESRVLLLLAALSLKNTVLHYKLKCAFHTLLWKKLVAHTSKRSSYCYNVKEITMYIIPN